MNCHIKNDIGKKIKTVKYFLIFIFSFVSIIYLLLFFRMGLLKSTIILRPIFLGALFLLIMSGYYLRHLKKSLKPTSILDFSSHQLEPLHSLYNNIWITNTFLIIIFLILQMISEILGVRFKS